MADWVGQLAHELVDGIYCLLAKDRQRASGTRSDQQRYIFSVKPANLLLRQVLEAEAFS